MKQQVPEQPITLKPSKATLEGFIPAMLKLENKSVLIVGGGAEATVLLHQLLQHTPYLSIRVVAPAFCAAIKLAAQTSCITLIERAFAWNDLDQTDVALITETDPETITSIQLRDKQAGTLIYVADYPDLSDIYFSPFLQKELAPVFEPDLFQVNTILNNDQHVNATAVLNNAFGYPASIPYAKNKQTSKVGALYLPSFLNVKDARPETYWKKIASLFLFAFFFMFAGHILLSYIPLHDLYKSVLYLPEYLDERFLWMIAAGFFAQLVDGALGMGYGVTCTTVLLSLGINLPAISASIHTAEMFSSGVSGYSHYKFGNVNKKLFKTLLIPGILGAIAGAYLLSTFGDEYANYIRPLLAAYTLVLGVRILRSAFIKRKKTTKVKRAGWLAGAGGFLDSFGGGGWGPLVTSTLISKGRTPKYVIGTVSITEFFVTLASAVTFFSLIGISHWQVLLGLIIGGMIGAPIAARLAGKLPLKTAMIGVGVMVIIWSIRILLKSLL